MARITIRVQPSASRDELFFEGQALRVRLAAPAVEGKANKRLIAVLAKRLGVRQADVSIVHGEKSREKVVEIAALGSKELLATLRLAIGPSSAERSTNKQTT